MSAAACNPSSTAIPGWSEASGAGFVTPIAGAISEQQWLEIQQRALHGQLAASAAHEMGNLLTIVLFNAGLLGERFRDDADASSHITPLLHAAQHMARLCGQMRNVSRLSPVTAARTVDLKELFKDTPQLFARLVPRKLTLEMTGDGPLPVVADPGHLEQIILNLILNASDATDDHTGCIQIRIGLEHPGRNSWRYLEIEDNGSGIPTHIKESLFKSCITTKARGKGTGLGLMTVGWLVANMHGKITVENAPVQGTVIRISLPPPPVGDDSTSSPTATGA